MKHSAKIIRLLNDWSYSPTKDGSYYREQIYLQDDDYIIDVNIKATEIGEMTRATLEQPAEFNANRVEVEIGSLEVYCDFADFELVEEEKELIEEKLIKQIIV
jgi:hypothetical protein